MIVPYVPSVFGPENLRPYLQALYAAPLRVLSVQAMDDGPRPGRRRLRVEIELDGHRRRIVVETLRSDAAGPQTLPDRARLILRAHDAAGRLPRHARSLDVGIVRGGGLQSLGPVEEYFLVTEDVDGRRYAEDLDRLARSAAPGALDLARADAICAWMASLHDRRAPDPAGYGGHLRSLIARGFAAADASSLPADRLRALEHRCLDARWALQDRPRRLRAVHGDLRPANLVFQAGTEFTALGGGTEPWGDPAEDLLALTLSYALASWRVRGRLDGALQALHTRAWRTYAGLSGDAEILEAAALLLVPRVLFLATAEASPEIRHRLLRLAERSLEAARYDPDQVEAWTTP